MVASSDRSSTMKRKATTNRNPTKRQKTEAPKPMPAVELSIREVDKLLPSLPACDLTDTPDQAYTPEKGFKALKRMTDYLKKILLDSDLGLPPGRISGWAKEMDDRNEKCVRETVIAVLGVIGAGKSSLINALVGRAVLLRQSNMKSCTSTVWELVYHAKDTIDAKIYTFTKEELMREFRCMKSDLTIEIEETGAEAIDLPRIARDKLAALCPSLSIEDFQKASIEELMNRPEIRDIVDTVHEISCGTEEEFKEKIAPYIEGPSGAVKLWPLVKSIECYLNAEVLSSGARLVDLPGLQDVNTARAETAKNYLKRADAYLIVTPMNRAISCRVAHDLLGDAFKRQLHMDCGHNERTISLVASKTDEIDAGECISEIPQLADDPEVQNLTNKLTSLEWRVMELEGKMSRKKAAAEECRADLEKAKRELNNSKPSQLGTGSTRFQSAFAIQRRHNAGTSGAQATVDQLATTLQAHIEAIQELQAQTYQAVIAKKDYGRQRDAICARARNESTIAESQELFRMGLKEMEEKQAVKADPDALTVPTVPMRDYSHINLPVFCVSSRDYSKIKRLQRINQEPTVFADEIDTQIPALRSHIQNITWARGEIVIPRVIEAQHDFIKGIEVYLTDEGRTCSKDGELSRNICQKDCEDLINLWENVANRKSVSLKREFRRAVEPTILGAAMSAKQGAVATVQLFGEDRAWNTYKASMVREGLFKKDNLNELLLDPLLNEITSPWHEVFNDSVKQLFKDLPSLFMEKTDQVFRSMQGRLAQSVDHRVEVVMEQQRKALLHGFEHTQDIATDTVQDIQKEISRKLWPDVQDELSEAYSAAALKKGRGCFNDMKAVMEGEVAENARTMFIALAKQTSKRLDELADDVFKVIKEDLDKLKEQMARAFAGIWEQMTASPEQILQRQAVRARVHELVEVTSKLLAMAKGNSGV